MITVLFFASLREELGCQSVQIAFESGMLLSALVERLISEHGPAWDTALRQENLIQSVNQQVVTEDVALNDGDEVAFFPPVTGG